MHVAGYKLESLLIESVHNRGDRVPICELIEQSTREQHGANVISAIRADQVRPTHALLSNSNSPLMDKKFLSRNGYGLEFDQINILYDRMII